MKFGDHCVNAVQLYEPVLMSHVQVQHYKNAQLFNKTIFSELKHISASILTNLQSQDFAYKLKQRERIRQNTVRGLVSRPTRIR